MKTEGFGRLTWYDGEILEGYFINNQVHGYSRVIYKSKDYYEGQ